MPDPSRSRWQSAIAERLDTFRGTIRRYLAGLGLARVAVVALAAFWLLDGFDLLVFFLTRLEQPQFLRTLLVAAAVLLVLATAAWWVLTRLVPRLTDEALALTIEARKPEFNGRLITSVQSKPGQTPIASVITERTQQQAADELEAVDLLELLDKAPLKRTALIALVLGLALVATAALNPGHVKRWADAYLFGVDDYWNAFRTNRLRLFVERGTPEQLIPFDSDRTIRAARGATLTLVAATESGAEQPDRVRLSISDLGPQRDSQTVSMIASAASTSSPVDGIDLSLGDFRHTLPRLYDDVDLSLLAGDFATALPYHVQVVPPPETTSLQFVADYPDYITRLSEESGVRQDVQSTTLSLPAGTRVTLYGVANSPLQSVRVSAADWRRSLAAGDGIDGETFAFAALVGDADESTQSASVTEPKEFEITLVDRDGLRSLSPLRLVMEPVADQPPEVTARPRGIGDAVTRRATVPFSGTIEDEYGLSDAWFRVATGDDSTRHPIRIVDGVRVTELDPADDESQLDLRDVQPQLGDVLSIAVVAADALPGPQPHVGVSETSSLTVVSDEELLAILRSKEVNLRQRFEQILEEVTSTRDDMRTELQREEEAATLDDSPERTELRQRISAGVDRSLLAVRKNAAESRSVFELFSDLRAEMVNNRVDTRDRLSRIDNGVLKPLGRVVDRDFDQVEVDMESAREAIRTRTAIAPSLATAERELSQLVDSLTAILSEMERRQSYNELIEELQKLTERYESLEKRTKEQNVDNFLDDLLN